ncbi:MAG: hypothetical protein J5644_03815 [Bacteroidales bacterium]|nr:hypothetical protein [Bacteroidales bacterium]
MEQTIRRSDVLAQMEVRETAAGKPLYFAIQFYKKDGELVTLTRARSCGLRMNMTDHRTRGVQQVDDLGNAIGHIYPVCIDNIRTFNGQRVKI